MWLVPAAPASPFPSQEWWPCQSSQQPGAGGQTGPGLACSCTRAGDCWQKATFNNIHTLQLCDETLQLNRVSVFEQENNLILPAQKFIKYHLRISMHAVIMIRKLSLYAIDKYLRVGFTLININIFSINYPRDVVIACCSVCQATKKWNPQEASLKILESKSLLQSALEKSNITMRLVYK